MDISTIISGLSLCIVFLTFVIGRGKEHDTQRENDIKMNVKLDSLCSSNNSILVELKAQGNKMQALETEMAVLKRDLKTAYTMIEELKEKMA